MLFSASVDQVRESTKWVCAPFLKVQKIIFCTLLVPVCSNTGRAKINMLFKEQYVCYSYLITQSKLQLLKGCIFLAKRWALKPLLQEGLLLAVFGTDSSELWRCWGCGLPVLPEDL